MQADSLTMHHGECLQDISDCWNNLPGGGTFLAISRHSSHITVHIITTSVIARLLKNNVMLWQICCQSFLDILLDFLYSFVFVGLFSVALTTVTDVSYAIPVTQTLSYPVIQKKSTIDKVASTV